MLFEDKELLKELTEQANKYKELLKTKKHWDIEDEELVNWHIRTVDLAEKLITEDDIPYPVFTDFRGYREIQPSVYIQATKIKRFMETVLNLFFLISDFMYEKLYDKPPSK